MPPVTPGVLALLLAAAVGSAGAQQPARPHAPHRPLQVEAEAAAHAAAEAAAHFEVFAEVHADALVELERVQDVSMHLENVTFHSDLAMAGFDRIEAEFSRFESHFDNAWSDAAERSLLTAERAVLDMARAEMAVPRLEMTRMMAEAGLAELVGPHGPLNIATEPPAPWAPQDTADGVYRTAREALNRGEYRRASQLFRQISDRHPRSSYAGDALYWEAFALYRIGTTPDLQRANQALDVQQKQFPQAGSSADARALSTRIRGALAMRGDPGATRQVTTAAGQRTGCDKEDLSVRIEALNALGQVDPATTTPLLQRVLQRRDECSVGLRKRAVLLLARRADDVAAETLGQVARTDPDASVRTDAISYLARTPGDRALAILDELARSSDDERAQRSALRALARHENPRARVLLRGFIDRPEVPERLRLEAIGSFDRQRTTPEEAAYIRGLYGRSETRAMKQRVIAAVASLGGAENDRWLHSIARNTNEPLELRSTALTAANRNDMPIAEMATLYDNLAERPLREQLINSFARRREPEATDKLIDIARTGTDPVLRRSAIAALTRKNDPRTTALLLEIVDR